MNTKLNAIWNSACPADTPLRTNQCNASFDAPAPHCSNCSVFIERPTSAAFASSA